MSERAPVRRGASSPNAPGSSARYNAVCPCPAVARWVLFNLLDKIPISKKDSGNISREA